MVPLRDRRAKDRPSPPPSLPRPGLIHHIERLADFFQLLGAHADPLVRYGNNHSFPFFFRQAIRIFCRRRRPFIALSTKLYSRDLNSSLSTVTKASTGASSRVMRRFSRTGATEAATSSKISGDGYPLQFHRRVVSQRKLKQLAGQPSQPFSLLTIILAYSCRSLSVTTRLQLSTIPRHITEVSGVFIS